MNYQITKGTTDVSVELYVFDSTTGLPEAAFDHSTTGIDLWYRRDGAVAVDITEAALAALTTAHTDGGVEYIGDGWVRLDLPDAACAAGVNKVTYGGTATDMVVIGGVIQLTDVDMFDGVRGGMTALPNAAADAAGGLPISDAGGLDLDTQIGTDIDAILTDTGTIIPGTIATIDGIVDDILVDTGTTLPAALATIDGNVDAILVDTDTTLDGKINTIDTNVDTLITNLDNVMNKDAGDSFDASTDSLQALRDGLATASDIRTEIDSNSTQLAAIVEDTGTTIPATIATIDSNVDSILTDTGTTIPATIATVDSNVDSILTDTGTTLPNLLSSTGVVLTAAGIDAIWDEAMHNSATARQLLGILMPAFVAGKTTGAATTTITFRDTGDVFNAIVQTVDAEGDRSAVTVNFS